MNKISVGAVLTLVCALSFGTEIVATGDVDMGKLSLLDSLCEGTPFYKAEIQNVDGNKKTGCWFIHGENGLVIVLWDNGGAGAVSQKMLTWYGQPKPSITKGGKES